MKCVFASALKQGLTMEPWLAWNLFFKPEKNLQSYVCFCLSSALIKGMIPHLAAKYFCTHDWCEHGWVIYIMHKR